MEEETKIHERISQLVLEMKITKTHFPDGYTDTWVAEKLGGIRELRNLIDS